MNLNCQLLPKAMKTYFYHFRKILEKSFQVKLLYFFCCIVMLYIYVYIFMKPKEPEEMVDSVKAEVQEICLV